MTTRVVVAVAAIGLAATGAARADAVQPAAMPGTAPAGDPDPAVEEASDANLESTANRSGLTFSGSLGGGLIVGVGINNAAGRGGSTSLRLGHVATPHTVITFEADVTLALHQPKDQPVQANSDVNLLAGAQYYVNPSLWLRFAGGLGVYVIRGILKAPIGTQTMPAYGDDTLIGPAVLAGIGVDLARFKWAVLGIEGATSAMINGDGVLMTSSLNLGLSFD
ncbi:MAG TPA: hypothetical protein VGD37_26120 [Kofleriaceae bacterium]